MGVADFVSVDNPVFCAYAFYSAFLVVKIFVTALLTSRHRFAKGVFINEEDVKINRAPKIIVNDRDVERVRRAHRNDLENILPFLVVGLLYVLTDPSPVLAVTLFRVFAIARVVHTIVYAVVVMPQPARAISFGVGMAVTFFMAVQVMMHFK